MASGWRTATLLFDAIFSACGDGDAEEATVGIVVMTASFILSIFFFFFLRSAKENGRKKTVSGSTLKR